MPPVGRSLQESEQSAKAFIEKLASAGKVYEDGAFRSSAVEPSQAEEVEWRRIHDIFPE